MVTARFTFPILVVLILVCAATPVVMAQHESGGDSASIKESVGGRTNATAGSTSRTSTPGGRATHGKPTPTGSPHKRAVRARKPGISAEAYNEQGDEFRNAGKYDEALAAYCKAISLKPDYAEPYYGIGWIHNEREEFDQAVDPLEHAIRYQPNYPLALGELGLAYRKLAKYDQALDAYRRAIILKPDYALAYLQHEAIRRSD